LCLTAITHNAGQEKLLSIVWWHKAISPVIF